jgi:hypothetical protein
MVFVYNNGGGNGIYRAGFGCTVTPAAPVCDARQVGPEFLQNLLGQIGGQLRYVSLDEFTRVTGLDWVEALKLMGKPGGFENLWQTINTVIQDQSRPGVPPSKPIIID